MNWAKIGVGIAGFVIAGFMATLPVWAAGFEATEEEQSETKAPQTQAEFTYRAPENVFMVAVIPGFVVHGLGHVMADDLRTGYALFGGEMVSLAMLGYGLRQAADDVQSGAIGSIWAWDKSSGANIIWGASAVFLITWAADFLHAPIAAEEYNQEHHLTPTIGLGPQGQPILLVQNRF